MTVYNLSKSGRDITWSEWKKHGGCDISNSAYNEVANKLGPSGLWKRSKVTTGDIADCSKHAERELARYAVERWERKDLVVVEYTDEDLRARGKT